jgi:hypothetical protein
LEDHPFLDHLLKEYPFTKWSFWERLHKEYPENEYLRKECRVNE